jgi:tetratricopeptide (TPR) repeat protein
MSFVFQRLTAAYDVLSNPKKKAEYDASIAEVLELRAIEKKLKAAMDRTSSDPVSTSTSKDQQLSDPVPAPLPSDGPPCDETSTRITIDKFTPSNPPKEADNARRDEIRRKRAEQAVADLLRRRSDSPVPPPDNLLEKMLSEAESALSQERPADAQAMCKKILAACPEHVGAKEILKQVSEIQSKTQAQMHIRRGRYAVREGQVKEAKWHLEQAVAVDKSNVDARHLLAEIMLTNERDAFSALAMMKEVIVLGGQKARYFITLGDIFLEMKDLDRAADAYNKALRMEPENPELKKKIRLCKR